MGLPWQRLMRRFGSLTLLIKVRYFFVLMAIALSSTSFNAFAKRYEFPHGIVNSSEVVDGYLNAYRIGTPPPLNTKYPLLYQRPQTFFEVTSENIDLMVSPHFTLGQFLCKQESEFPKYLVLQEPLLELLEGLVEAVKVAGYPVKTFGVISGYRTPYYNKRIGNVANSRHIYGDAMDFFVDVDGDGRMDDLNGDGQHNREDVDILYKIVVDFKARPENTALVGGVGRYYQTSHHGGFIHVDTRGYKARW